MESVNKEPTYYSMEDYPNMSDSISAVYNELDKRLMNIDDSIVREYKKCYIAYKSDTNFVNIKPSKNELTISFNIPFEKIKDKKGLCMDYTGIGNFASNDVLLKVNEITDLNYVMHLAMQALDYQLY